MNFIFSPKPTYLTVSINPDLAGQPFLSGTFALKPNYADVANLSLSCRNCWFRAVSRIGLVAVFLSAGALHVADPMGINHYGLPTWFSYILACVEILSSLALLFDFDAAKYSLVAIVAAGAACHIRAGEFTLLILPLIPGVLLTLNWRASSPQAACTCAPATP